jgi:hypothetical protein
VDVPGAWLFRLGETVVGRAADCRAEVPATIASRSGPSYNSGENSSSRENPSSSAVLSIIPILYNGRDQTKTVRMYYKADEKWPLPFD